VQVFPAAAVNSVWAIQGRDSVEMTKVDGEYYLRFINPGHWQVSVKTKEPYANAQYEMDVKPGADRDLGAIRLQ